MYSLFTRLFLFKEVNYPGFRLLFHRIMALADVDSKLSATPVTFSAD